MESRKIASAIEELHPGPKAHLDNEIHLRTQKALNTVLMTLQAVLVPRMPRECLSGPTIQYHRDARVKTYGMTLEELEATSGGDECWRRAEPHLKTMAGILRENPSGPFCLGDVPSYADFLIVGFLEWCRLLGGDCLERVYKVDPAFASVYNACEPWLKRNDR